MRKGFLYTLFLIFACMGLWAQTRMGIAGNIEWDTQRINAHVSLDLASAGLRLPAGRTQGEAILRENYLNLIRPAILSIQVDSSSTVGSLLESGELTLPQIDSFALGAVSVAPALSPDMRRMSTSHTIPFAQISSSLIRHSRPSPVIRTLNPVSSARYTGIIIIASESLPVHGMRSTALAEPCLFPKIWDSEMNLIYDRSMLEIRVTEAVKYSVSRNIFYNHPSGLSPEIREAIGDRPLRIFASGVFGIKPTDLIIDRSDAMQIISSEENRRLLSQGRIVIILDESVLSYGFSFEQ